MSADGHTVCPKCHPDLVGWRSGRYSDTSISDHAAEELGYERDLREYFEFYIKNGNILVSSYSGDCRLCGFEFDIIHEDPIPGLT